MFMAELFYVFAAFIVISAIFMVTTRNIFHCTLFMAAVLFGVAGLYVMIGAFFLAAIQILVYVGAVVVLTIFVVNLTKSMTKEESSFITKQIPIAIIAVLLSTALIIVAFLRSGPSVGLPVYTWQNETASIGRLLLSDFVLPFEIASVLLLGALIAAIVIVTRDPGDAQ
jgi:NADH:ubiquinone oxidoreductase subunit 6 (subunit J)